jgi:hypothetical protein
MTRKILLVTCLVLFFGTVSVWGGNAEKGSTDAPKARYTAEGNITFIERDGTVIIRPDAPARTGPDRIVYIKNYTNISRNGKPATAKDLKPGDHVWVAVGPMRDALEMKATGP